MIQRIISDTLVGLAVINIFSSSVSKYFSSKKKGHRGNFFSKVEKRPFWIPS
jgi:hypothetical protein